MNINVFQGFLKDYGNIPVGELEKRFGNVDNLEMFVIIPEAENYAEKLVEEICTGNGEKALH